LVGLYRFDHDWLPGKEKVNSVMGPMADLKNPPRKNEPITFPGNFRVTFALGFSGLRDLVVSTQRCMYYRRRAVSMPPRKPSPTRGYLPGVVQGVSPGCYIQKLLEPSSNFLYVNTPLAHPGTSARASPGELYSCPAPPGAFTSFPGVARGICPG